jgi:hypothetical protein
MSLRPFREARISGVVSDSGAGLFTEAPAAKSAMINGLEVRFCGWFNAHERAETLSSPTAESIIFLM